MQNKFIYHCSPASNKEYILKNGILPKDRNFVNGITYKNRIYFFTDGNIQHLRQYAKGTIGPEHKTTDFILVTIDMEKVPQYVQFFYDPLYGKESVWTEDEIPSEAIDSIIDLK